ncbi:MAG: hypothetical protein MJ180_02685 [Candidatus Gastranaerophilales bacterium]|nr:hypothetical protein [Candidatus Gastranaerophilales bacterium]
MIKHYTNPLKDFFNISLQKTIKRLLRDDLKPLVYLEDEIKLSNEFMYTNKIRYQNSVLANLITSAIKTAALKKYPDIDTVSIPATIIRSGMKSKPQRTAFNNVDLFDMFKGVDVNVEGISKGTITGNELIKLIFENVKNNLKSPTRKALIHWSDIQIDRTAIEKAITSKRKIDLSKVIKIRNKKTGQFEEINRNKNYCILLADKYLIKDNDFIRVPSQIRHKFTSIKETYDELFKEYINIVNGKVQLTDEIIEKRIL